MAQGSSYRVITLTLYGQRHRVELEGRQSGLQDASGVWEAQG